MEIWSAVTESPLLLAAAKLRRRGGFAAAVKAATAVAALQKLNFSIACLTRKSF